MMVLPPVSVTSHPRASADSARGRRAVILPPRDLDEAVLDDLVADHRDDAPGSTTVDGR